MKIFLTIIAVGFMMTIKAEQYRTITTRRGKEISKINAKKNSEPVSYKKVMTKLMQWRKSIIEGDAVKKRPLGAMDYTAYASHVDSWLQQRDLVLNTKIERPWYVKIKAMLLYMARIKRYLEHAKMDGVVNVAQVDKKRASFLKAYDQFNNLITHPQKITKTKWIKLKRAKKIRDKKKK